MEPPQRQLVLLDDAPAEPGGHAWQGRARAERVLLIRDLRRARSGFADRHHAPHLQPGYISASPSVMR
jgi:hypothetical protein